MPDDFDLILTIDANRFDDIAGFYAELNRVFMPGEDWQLGESLDALDDMLYGGYGMLKDAERVRLYWVNMEKSRSDLGIEATRQWLLSKLDRYGQFNADHVRKQLHALASGEGKTYFDIVLEIIESHPTVCLTPI